MKRPSSDRKRPPVVRATEGRSTALEAGANPTYGTVIPAGKRFHRMPDNTGDNSRDQAPPIEEGERVWTHSKRGGEVRATVSLYKRSRFLNLRWWVVQPHGFAPTPKGVTIPLDAVSDLAEALTAYVAANGSGGT